MSATGIPHTVQTLETTTGSPDRSNGATPAGSALRRPESQLMLGILNDSRKQAEEVLSALSLDNPIVNRLLNVLESGYISLRPLQTIMERHLEGGNLIGKGPQVIRTVLAGITGDVILYSGAKELLITEVNRIGSIAQTTSELQNQVDALLLEAGLQVPTTKEKNLGIPKLDVYRYNLLELVAERLRGVETMTYGEVLLNKTEAIAAAVGSVKDVYSKGIGRVVEVYENVASSMQNLYGHVPRKNSFFRELLSRIRSVFKSREELMLNAMLYTVEGDIKSILDTNIGDVISSGIPESLYELHRRIKDMEISDMTPTEEEIYGKMLMVPGPSRRLPIPKVLQDLAESFGKSVDKPDHNPLPLRDGYGIMHRISQHFDHLNQYVEVLRNDEDFANSTRTFIEKFVQALSSDNQKIQNIIEKLESRISQLEDVITLASNKKNEKVLQRAQAMHANYSRLVETLRQGVTSQDQSESNINIGDTLVNIQKNIGQVNKELGNYDMHTQAILQIEGVRGR
ncbi:MAG: hypothetical protein KatS3mg084_0224 [Candidatus Dojkabacteria bacterium]|nr:MAG: hypothetical protein KatS3mg084_0224 [Candidatus Dojkabacteria bacterium]